MFCPKCATQNIDGASFCRTCGANISLIPQALTGQLAQPPQDDLEEGSRARRRHGRRDLSLDQAFKNAFMGLAFLLVAVALAYTRMGGGWWFWMLIPAFSMMGTGIAQYIRLKEREKRAIQPGSFVRPSMHPAAPEKTFPARNTGELVPPQPSVTEGTTRHLGADAQPRHLDSSSESREIN